MINIIHGILLILYIIDCIALTVESYWGKNKGRSMEGGLVLATRIMAVLFVVFSLLLNLNIFS